MAFVRNLIHINKVKPSIISKVKPSIFGGKSVAACRFASCVDYISVRGIVISKISKSETAVSCGQSTLLSVPKSSLKAFDIVGSGYGRLVFLSGSFSIIIILIILYWYNLKKSLHAQMLQCSSKSGGVAGGQGGDGSRPAASSSDQETVIQNVSEVCLQVPLLTVPKLRVFPKCTTTIEVKDKQIQDLIRRNFSLNQTDAVVFLRKDETSKSDVVYSLDEIYDVGMFVKIHKFEDIGDKMRVTIKGHRRIRVLGELTEETVKTNSTFSTSQNSGARPILMVDVENFVTEKVKTTKEINALTQEIVKTFEEMVKSLAPQNKVLLQGIHAMKSRVANEYETLCDVIAFIVGSGGDPKEQQAIIGEANIPKRLNMALSMLKKLYESTKVEVKIDTKVVENVKAEKEKEALNEMLKRIEKELGIENVPNNAVVEKFKKKLEGKIVPAHVMEVIEAELQKISFLKPCSSEYGVIHNYLEWLTSMPWGITNAETFDLQYAKEVLENDHYGMEDLKKRILEFIAVSKLKGSTHGKILCLVGAPGVGKTSVAKSVATSMGKDYFRITVGGLHDEAEIKGHRRTYVGAIPGKPIQCLKETKTENPLIIIDEIDKMGRSNQGDPGAALLELLDPEQNSNFLDHYLDVPVDLSKALFICTANTLDTIPAPLRDRMEIIHVSGYLAEEKLAIAQRYLIPQTSKNTGINEKQVTFDEGALMTLITWYCRESGVRSLQKQIEKVFRKAAFKIANKECEQVVVTSDNLKDFVGQPLFSNDRMYKTTPPGVVMGLAWTDMGGSTSYIETAFRKPYDADSKEDGSMELTGNLGDVMKESARIAYSFARSFLIGQDPTNQYLNKAGVHVHVPEGGIPKEGPSAGCAIVTALLSLAMQKPIRQNLAMTGEISLTGKVLPVGGIKEKIMAAKRAGVNCVILPAENKQDFTDLPSYIKDELEVHYVEHYQDVFKIVFPQ